MSSSRSIRGSRHGLIADLNRAAREASGLGVMFGEVVAQRLGLDQTALECLGVIAEREDVTAGALATATALTTGAVTGVIDRLEKAGFARRVRDPADRRKVYVRATPQALRQAEAFYGPMGRAVDALAARYTDREVALLVDYFERARELMLGEIARVKAPAKKRTPKV
jgi:DNA-binding MarR family transcriptional regulator